LQILDQSDRKKQNSLYRDRRPVNVRAKTSSR